MGVPLPSILTVTEIPFGSWLLPCVASFLLGAIPFAWILGRFRGIDIREMGSGNVGATNLVRNAGFPLGVTAGLLDLLKGYLPVVAASGGLISGGEFLPLIIGVFAVFGHCYTPFLGFKGGKGVATMAGALLALNPAVLVILLAVWGGALAVLRVVGIASVTAAGASVVVGAWLVFSSELDPDRVLGGVLCLLGGLVVVRHRSNITSYLSRQQLVAKEQR